MKLPGPCHARASSKIHAAFVQNHPDDDANAEVASSQPFVIDIEEEEEEEGRSQVVWRNGQREKMYTSIM